MLLVVVLIVLQLLLLSHNWEISVRFVFSPFPECRRNLEGFFNWLVKEVELNGTVNLINILKNINFYSHFNVFNVDKAHC